MCSLNSTPLSVRRCSRKRPFPLPIQPHIFLKNISLRDGSVAVIKTSYKAAHLRLHISRRNKHGDVECGLTKRKTGRHLHPFYDSSGEVFEKWLRVKIDDNDRKATVTLLGKFSFPDLADAFPGSISRFRYGNKEIRVSVYLLLLCVLQLCFLFRKVGCLLSRHELRLLNKLHLVFHCCQFVLFCVVHFYILKLILWTLNGFKKNNLFVT